MAKTNKQQKEIDELIIERNNLIDRVDELEKWIDKIVDELWIIKNIETYNTLSFGKITREIHILKRENEELKEENHDLDTMVINMKERIKELEEQKNDDWRSNRYNKIVWKCKKLEDKYEQCFEELSTKLSEESDFDILIAENEVIKQDKANLLAELTRQINEKSTLRKENKRLKKRRRDGRYNIDKFIHNLTKWAYVYVEWASRPTKLHKRLRDAIAEKQRLEDKTWKKVYILTNL